MLQPLPLRKAWKLASALVALTGLSIAVVGCAGGGGSTTAPPPSQANNPTPAVTAVTPSTVIAGGTGTTVTVTGTGFIQSSQVRWNQTNRATTFVSATQLQATLSSADIAAAGSGQIDVVNPAPGGGTSSEMAVAINNPLPQITGFSPNLAAVASVGATVTITGSGFVPTSVVTVNGATRSSVYVSSTQLQFALVASDVAAVGSITVSVQNYAPGGGMSPAANLPVNYAVPLLTSLTPASLPTGSPDSPVYISGSGFTSSSAVQVNGTAVTVSAWNFGQLTFTLPATDMTAAGTLTVTVSNPGTLVSNPLTFSVGLSPSPTLTSLYPTSAAVGAGDQTITVNGSNFVATSVVQWNGSARATTYISPSQLTAVITALDLQTLGNNNVTVSTPTPGGGVSAPQVFTTYLGLLANDLVYNPTTQLLYAAVPSNAGAPLGNSIVSIDPYTGVLGNPIYVGSEPTKLALSSDGGTMWVSLNGAAAVREVNLTNGTAGLQFSLGGGAGVYNPPFQASAMAVMPGQANTVAIATPNYAIYSNTVTIYDSGVSRANTEPGTLSCCSGIVAMTFDPTGTTLYQAGSGYGTATVGSTGISAASELNSAVSTNELRVANGRAYLTNGAILNASTGTQLGVFETAPEQQANGTVAPDTTLGKAFMLVNPIFGPGYQINVYDLSTFVLDGTIPVQGVNNFLSSPRSMQRWGQNGLAFTTGSQVYILRSPQVKDLSSSLADLSVTTSVPASGATGTNLTYTLTIANAGPLPAAPVTLIDNIPDATTLQSVTSSQGNCTPGAVIYCNLGNLNSASSATVTITVTPNTAAVLSNTASVSAPQGDPIPANNVSVTTTTVTGSLYSAVPVLASISPEFAEAGAPTFTLTVSGSGFSTNSVVQLGSTALPTTFVSGTQLTATVDASNVANLGWAWVQVVTSAPGGGSSETLPLTVYKVLSLDVNRMTFDPYTRKLYATLPSTAAQVPGNSLVPIDPTSGTLGSGLSIGSEPNRLAETSDGNYLYVGLDGAQSLTSVNLSTFTQGPVFAITIPNSKPPQSVAARDLAVAPGNDNLLAIDTGIAGGGIGLMDIAGSTGTMRSTLTGVYTGSDLAFLNASTLYSYDIDTSGAEFYRWQVTSTGLAGLGGAAYQNGYTLDGIGGFGGGFELVNQTVYGFAGGVANPVTTPPTQLGQFGINSSQGSVQSVEGSGVAADPNIGRVFFLGETVAGTANPVLLSYDANHYLLIDAVPFANSAQGLDLVRWGRDGLAWHSSLGGPFGSTAGTGQVFLVRGPFVLPEWGMANATPTLTSASPSTIAAGSGNLTLAVTGTNFVPGAVVSWNGAERSTTFVSSTNLTVAIPAADVSTATNPAIAVNNPGTANSASLTITVH